jgi:hypothetical protein
MNSPDVVSTIRDDERGITYRIVAYRALTYAEKVSTVQSFLAQKRKPKLKPGSTITMMTIIGHDAPVA